MMSLENRGMLGVEYLLPFLLWKLRGRVAPKILLIAEKCAGSQDIGPLPCPPYFSRFGHRAYPPEVRQRLWRREEDPG